MLQVICGFVVGLLLAGLGFGLVGGGVPGLIVAVVLAALGYIAASTLTEPLYPNQSTNFSLPLSLNSKAK